MARVSGGACQDIFRVVIEFDSGSLAGRHTFALRSDAPTSLAGSLDRRTEFEVVRSAAAAGVRTPAVHWLGTGLLREGAHAYFMDWVTGETIGRRILKSPELADARSRLPDELAAELAKIHTITPASHPHLGLAPVDDPASNAIRRARASLDAIPEPHPALELALLWLEANRPARSEVTLVHGDFRTGNFAVAPEGLVALLDWEFSGFSDPVEDIGWLCVRDWRFGQLKRPAGGLATRERFVDAYERASSRTVDRQTLLFWEVMGNVRWATGSIQQGERYLAGRHDIELIAIGRRAVEMEYEALRLMERGA